MPASKPNILNTRNDTKSDRAARNAAESAMKPKTPLSLDVPSGLNGHKIASATWKRIVGLYLETDGDIATSFDVDLLVKYCLLEEEVVQLAKMRESMRDDWQTNQKTAKKIKPKSDTLKTWVQMWDVVNGMFQRFQGMDARLDGKRKLLLSVSQSLYLTPRSRAGVAPPEKEKPPEKKGMEAILGE